MTRCFHFKSPMPPVLCSFPVTRYYYRWYDADSPRPFVYMTCEIHALESKSDVRFEEITRELADVHFLMSS